MNIPISKIKIHRLIANLPMLEESSPEFQNLLASVMALGLDNEPLKVITVTNLDEPMHILIDGRHRLAAAKIAALKEVPCIVCDADQAEEIILNSLISRRHMTKGALAYTSFPVLVAMHVHNGGDRKSASTESTLIAAADLSERLGFSRDLFFQAQTLHKIYAEQPDYKTLTEQRVMSGEIGLGAAMLRIGPHSILDLGDDAYTRGRPHPLIDPRLRNAELLAQAQTGEVGLFLVDVILGTGSHADPAGALLPSIAAARALADARGAQLAVLASLCGTEDDSQGYRRQLAALEGAGVRVARSSSMAAAVAGRVAALLAEVER